MTDHPWRRARVVRVADGEKQKKVAIEIIDKGNSYHNNIKLFVSYLLREFLRPLFYEHDWRGS